MGSENSEGLVGAVAEGTFVGVLAAAEVDRAVGFSRIRYRGEGRTLVGAVAERLGLRMAARTPVVGLTGFVSSSSSS